MASSNGLKLKVVWLFGLSSRYSPTEASSSGLCLGLGWSSSSCMVSASRSLDHRMIRSATLRPSHSSSAILSCLQSTSCGHCAICTSGCSWAGSAKKMSDYTRPTSRRVLVGRVSHPQSHTQARDEPLEAGLVGSWRVMGPHGFFISIV